MFFPYSPPRTSLLLVTLSPHPCLFPSRIPCDSFAGLTLLHGLSIIWLIIQGCCYMAFTLFKDMKLILFGLMFLSRIFAKIILKCYFEIRLEDFCVPFSALCSWEQFYRFWLVGLLQKSIYVICKRSAVACCPFHTNILTSLGIFHFSVHLSL